MTHSFRNSSRYPPERHISCRNCTTMKSVSSFVVLVAVFGGAHGFAPAKLASGGTRGVALDGGRATSVGGALSAWSNPFSREPEPGPVPVEVDPVPGPLDAKNAIAAAVWIGLVTWAFNFAPGSLGSDADAALVQRLISQPVPRPEEINELWFAVWNSFAVVPAVLAALAAPTGRGQRLPASPFLWGSAAFGYFSLGPYFATRTVTVGPLRRSDLGWASRNVFESRAFGIVVAAIALSIPVTSDLLVPGFDFGAKAAEYADMFASSRFVSVASADIAIMSALASVLVSEDCKLRGWEDRSTALLAGTLLLPVLGPCLYLAARPSLEE